MKNFDILDIFQWLDLERGYNFKVKDYFCLQPNFTQIAEVSTVQVQYMLQLAISVDFISIFKGKIRYNLLPLKDRCNGFVIVDGFVIDDLWSIFGSNTSLLWSDSEHFWLEHLNKISFKRKGPLQK